MLSLASYDSSSFFYHLQVNNLSFVELIPISSVNCCAFLLYSGYEIFKFMVGITKDLIIIIVQIKFDTQLLDISRSLNFREIMSNRVIFVVI